MFTIESSKQDLLDNLPFGSIRTKNLYFLYAKDCVL